MRNEKPLTKQQLNKVYNYTDKLGISRSQIRYGEHYNTSYGSAFDMLYIGTDVYPSEKAGQKATKTRKSVDKQFGLE